MDERQQQRQFWITAVECARQCGVTVRALRVYERHRLLTPRRTAKNWRLYGVGEVARVGEIKLLKSLGLSLASIAKTLGGRSASLDALLGLQEALLKERQAQASAGLRAIAAARKRANGVGGVTVGDLLKLLKETDMTADTLNQRAWRRYEQAKPRQQTDFDALAAEGLTGHFLFEDGGVLAIRPGPQGLQAQLTGQPAIDIYPEGPRAFFCKIVTAQFSFAADSNGQAQSVTLHQDGFELTAHRITEAQAMERAKRLKERITRKIPFKDSERVLRHVVEDAITGNEDYSLMSEPLACVAREQKQLIQTEMERVGSFRSSSFEGVSEEGWDVYRVTFETGVMEWRFFIGENGKITGLLSRPVP